MEEKKVETSAELQSRFREYLHDVAWKLRKEQNIHTWHIIDIPVDIFPDGIIINQDIIMYESKEASAVLKNVGGKVVARVGGFNFIIRHPHHPA
jgi:hypothetical protein